MEILEDSYIVIEGKQVKAVYRSSLPEEYRKIAVTDYGSALIIPGFIDLHAHAPQFANRGLGLDCELLPWLEQYTFPEEAKFQDIAYAETVYRQAVAEFWKWGTTRVVLFGTIHKHATAKLMDLVAAAGLGGYVGKVNMDRNSPVFLRETTRQSLTDTEEFIQHTRDKYELVKPIITPRFAPACTPELMKGLAALAQKYNVPVQSHLSENIGEVALVRSLYPEYRHYADVYEQLGLFGQQPTIMAHCVHNDDAEIALMAKNNIHVAHCPYSNTNLASGIAPLHKYIRCHVAVGLASDISGGHEVSIARAIVMAVQVSKLKWLEGNRQGSFLTIPEAFYLATKGGGSFLGKVGSFEKGYEFDALVIDDSALSGSSGRVYSIEERLNRFIYLGDDRNIAVRYVAGRKINSPNTLLA